MAAWFNILQVARTLCPDGKTPFGSGDLSRKARIAEGASSRPEQIASAWLGKFVRWGYAKRVGTSESAERRWRRAYVLTDFGLTVQPAAGRFEKCETLTKALRDYQKAKGTRLEEKSWKTLLKACERVEEADA